MEATGRKRKGGREGGREGGGEGGRGYFLGVLGR